MNNGGGTRDVLTNREKKKLEEGEKKWKVRWLKNKTEQRRRKLAADGLRRG